MKIALGVTGCIGAYKAVLILRLLQDRGATVQVVMTRSARQFVGPITFQALSGLPVITDTFALSETSEIQHIALAQSIDLLLVAPATANIIAKFAHGIADDFLSTLLISTTAPVLIAPAMNVEMWRNAATRANVQTLIERGVEFVDPEAGYLACRTVGEGRLAEPEKIVERAIALAARRSSQSPISAVGDLRGERLLVTAGPTCEDIDPVRFITNRSSGKMGYAIARAARERGADVTLISGPTRLSPPPQVDVINVRTTAQMYQAVLDNLDKATIIIKAAAVNDYRPAAVSEQKIKKAGGNLVIELEKTEDILAEIGRRKGRRILIGFAAETQNLVENAKSKLSLKNLDMIVANDVTRPGAGFDADTNIVTLIASAGEIIDLPEMPKYQIANRILDEALRIKFERLQLQNHSERPVGDP